MLQSLVAVVASAAVASALLVSSPPPEGAVNQPARLHVAVPAYIFSDDLRGWEAIIDRASVTPVAVINPRNGPNVFAGTRCEGFTPPDDPGTGPNLAGLRLDDTFVSARFPNDPTLNPASNTYLATLEQQFIRRAQAMSLSGISVFGYVWSNTNGADPGCVRTPAIVSDEIDRYKQRYGIANVFFDDASASCPNNARRALSELARGKGAKVILNAGTPADSCLANEGDIVVNFEGTPAAYSAKRDALIANATLLRSTNSLVKIWHILYGATDSELPGIISQAQLTSDFLYITDDTTLVHGCDRGTSNFDALFGTWPIVRQDIQACANRSNGSANSWSSVVDTITQSVPSVRQNVPAASGPPGPPISARAPAPGAPANGPSPRVSVPSAQVNLPVAG